MLVHGNQKLQIGMPLEQVISCPGTKPIFVRGLVVADVFLKSGDFLELIVTQHEGVVSESVIGFGIGQPNRGRTLNERMRHIRSNLWSCRSEQPPDGRW